MQYRLRTLDLLILSGIAVPLLQVAARFSGPDPFCGVWEDSSMLSRYADHLLKYHALAWNPGGEPTYGLTAPYYLFLVLPLRIMTPQTPLLTVVLGSVLCGCLFFVLLFWMLHSNVRASPWARRVAYFLIAASLAGASPDLVRHFLSGMDTMFALAYLCVYISLAGFFERSGSIWAAVATGIVGGLAFGCRPDLMIYTAVVPACFMVWCPERHMKRRAGLVLAITGVCLLLEMGAAALYFHTPVPLPFYAKALHLYEGFTRYQHIPFSQFFNFLVSYRFLFLVIGMEVWRAKTTPLEKGLLVATTLFISYYLLFVLQIMYMNQRFYYPTLPAIALLAARSMARLTDRLVALPRFAWVVSVIFCWLLLLPMQISAITEASMFATYGVASFQTLDEYKEYWGDIWYRLDEFSKLPNDMVMATTELGHPGIMNPDRIVVDVSGLNDPAFAKQKFSADRLFQLYQPDLIYMPPRAYHGMVQNLIENVRFRQDYDYYPEHTLTPYAMGVAIRRSSKYYPRLKQIVTEPHEPIGDPGAVYR